MRRFEDAVQNQFGQALANVQVTVYLPGTTTKVTLYVDDGITIGPNPVTTDALGRFSFYVPTGKYDFAVSGSQIVAYTVSNVEVADILEYQAPDAQPWTTQTLNFANQAAGPTPLSGTVNVYSKLADKRLYYKDDTGTEIGPLNSGAGGSILATNNNFTGTNDFQNDLRFKGPNPWVDIRDFGARAVASGSIPTTTASITSGLSTATVANGSAFQNGDGIRIDGAGATNTLSTPSAPTVQSVLLGAPIGTPQFGNANAGSTTYNYQIVARTKLGALTAASPVGSTTTGLASLGIQSTTISSTSLSGTTVTVNTSAPSDIVPGTMIWQPGSGNQPWTGLFRVNQVNSTTQFTFTQQGLDTIGAGPILTSGTINYITGNHISWTAVPNAFQYYVYFAGSLISATRPGETFYDDYGATIRGTPLLPSYVPSSAPGAATNEPLVTTIVSGGGSNTFVLAAAASQTVAGARAVFDDAPAIKAAYNSVYSAASGTPLYFASPSPPARNSYIINSYLDLTAVQQLNVIQAAPIFINEPIAIPAGTYWEGLHGVGGSNPPSFGWGQYREIQTNTALPGIYASNGNQINFDGIDFIGNHDQALSMLIDTGFNIAFNRCYFSTSATAGTGTIDYTSMGLMTRGVKNVVMNRVSLISQMQNNLAMGPWAGVYTGRSDLSVTNNTGQNFITNLFTAAKGIAIDYTGPFSDMQGHIDGYYTQGSRTPLLTLSGGSSLPGSWRIALAECDTTGVPILSNLTITGFLNVDFQNNSGASPGCTPISGNLIASITGIGDFQATNSAVSNAYTASDGTRGQTFTDRIVNVKGPGTFIHAIGAYPVAPTLSLVAGGAFSLTQHCFRYQWYDLLGNGGNISPFTCITPTSGNQSVQVTVGTPPLGAFGFYVYADSARRNLGTPDFCSPTIQNGLTRIDTGGGTCGQSALASAGIGDSGIRNQNIFSPSFTLIDPNNTGWLINTAVPKALTNNRTVSYPDQSGALVLTGNLQSVYDGFNRADGAPGANYTNLNGGTTIVSNVLKGTAGVYNASAYTGITFQKDQFAQATILNFANGETGVFVRNAGYDCTQSATQFLMHSNFAANTLSSVGITGAAGDVILAMARGTTITCMRFVGGVLTNTLSATDGAFTTGQPGAAIRQFNGSLTNSLDDLFVGNIDPLAHLDNEQAWTTPQHFITGLTLGSSTGPIVNAVQGNGAKAQLATGATTTNNFLKYDANGNAIDSGGNFAAPGAIGGTTPGSGAFTTLSATGQVTSTLATGTAPLVVTSTTPVANLTTVPVTYNKSGTQQTGVHIVLDSGTLAAGTLTVTLTGAAVFTSSSSYVCSPDDTTGINGIDVVYNSGSSVTFNGTGTDAIRYMCVGN